MMSWALAERLDHSDRDRAVRKSARDEILEQCAHQTTERRAVVRARRSRGERAIGAVVGLASVAAAGVPLLTR